MRQTRQTSASDSSIFHVLLIILKVFKIFNFFGKWHGFWVVKVIRQSCSLWAASTSGRRFFCFLWFLFLLLFFFLFNYNDVIIIFILLGKKLEPISIWRFWRRVRRQRGPNVLGVICIVPVVVLIKFWKIRKIFNFSPICQYALSVSVASLWCGSARLDLTRSFVCVKMKKLKMMTSLSHANTCPLQSADCDSRHWSPPLLMSLERRRLKIIFL